MAIFYEKGRYRCRITDQALGKATTGTPQFALKFTVLHRIVSPGSFADVTQYERTAYFYITEKTAARFGENLHNLGFTGSSFKQLDLEHPQAHDFRDSEVDMYCGEDANLQGEPKERWGVARPSTGLDIQPLDNKSVRELDNLFGKHLKPVSGGPKPVAAPAPADKSEWQPDDSDIPF